MQREILFFKCLSKKSITLKTKINKQNNTKTKKQNLQNLTDILKIQFALHHLVCRAVLIQDASKVSVNKREQYTSSSLHLSKNV